ncbi:hypothetical protein VTK73DRAFT_1936 [Phialemonium thermophilum]|uniref:Wings apart-like protein C-terminal domain-containing protein n=1 Tax=Phialemonium thermophilum TaxID=223376 RepID=A0ABR3X7A4_9PEZI
MGSVLDRSPDLQNQQWTATRCHRLLRPLLTHVAALRKELKWQQACCTSQPRQVSKNQEDQPGPSAKRSYSELGAFPVRKRARYTYSQRTSKTASHGPSSQDGHDKTAKRAERCVKTTVKEGIALPTPVIRRIRGRSVASPAEDLAPKAPKTAIKSGRCHHSPESCAHRCAFELELSSLRQRTDPSLFLLYESIFRALDALLRATSSQKSTPSAPKSLLAMCLRKVPDYIGELEYWKRKDAEATGSRLAPDDSEPSFELYSELEYLGTGGLGWKHLSTVVRAHGIKIVRDAVSEGLLDLDFSIMLARLCEEPQSFTCRGRLLQVAVSKEYPNPASPDDWFAGSPETKPLHLLLQSPRMTFAQPFQCSIMTSLLNNRLLPWEWALTRDFGTIWSRAVAGLAQDGVSRDTIEYVVASLQVLCHHSLLKGRRPINGSSGAQQQSLVSALTALVTMAVLGSEALGDCLPSSSYIERVRSTNRRLEYVIRACLSRLKSSKRHGGRNSHHLLLLGAYLCSSVAEGAWQGGSSSKGIWADALRASWDRSADITTGQGRQHYECTLALLCSIAQCCARETRTPAHVYLTDLCNRLDSARPPSQHVREDAAFLLADQTSDLRDLAFAEGLKAKATGDTEDKQMQESCQRKTAFSGFRWDAGISEWVTASPVIQRKATKAQPKPTFNIRRRHRAEERNQARHFVLDSTAESGSLDVEKRRRQRTLRPDRALACRPMPCNRQLPTIRQDSQAEDDSDGKSEKRAMVTGSPQNEAGRCPAAAAEKENRTGHGGAIGWNAPTRRRGRVSLQTRRTSGSATSRHDFDDFSDDELAV